LSKGKGGTGPLERSVGEPEKEGVLGVRAWKNLAKPWKLKSSAAKDIRKKRYF